MNSLDIAKIAAKAADSKKGQDIQVIGIRDISVLADYFVLVTGDSSTQVKRLLRMRLNISLAKQAKSLIILRAGSPDGFVLIFLQLLFMFSIKSKGSISTLNIFGKTAIY